MNIEGLLNTAGKSTRLSVLSRHKKEASQILAALEGLSIREARELLEACHCSLELMEVTYNSFRCETTS